ncbi:hypothetical protein HDU91_000435 [Kappamyces sp. JEL0680]|nr:hypothetical protein HDU91_000435 [Kappamyces sp. JEL0680]
MSDAQEPQPAEQGLLFLGKSRYGNSQEELRRERRQKEKRRVKKKKENGIKVHRRPKKPEKTLCHSVRHGTVCLKGDSCPFNHCRSEARESPDLYHSLDQLDQ